MLGLDHTLIVLLVLSQLVISLELGLCRVALQVGKETFQSIQLGTVDGGFLFYLVAHVLKSVPKNLVLITIDLFLYYKTIYRLSFFVFLEITWMSCFVDPRESFFGDLS